MVYDITQSLPGCDVYPGDSRPEIRRVLRMEDGSLYNLSELSMCVHNGTHVDAPRHFIRDGKSIDQLDPEIFFGPAYVHYHQGDVTETDAATILQRAERHCGTKRTRILLKGPATITLEAAQVFAKAGILLIGNESQTVGPEDQPMAVHLVLLGAGIPLLEGVRLGAVPEGAYLLSCPPMNITESDGAPCRALLSDLPSRI